MQAHLYTQRRDVRSVTPPDDGLTQSAISPPQPVSYAMEFAASMESIHLLHHFDLIFGRTLYIHTAVCTVHKVPSLLSNHAHYLCITQL